MVRGTSVRGEMQRCEGCGVGCETGVTDSEKLMISVNKEDKMIIIKMRLDTSIHIKTLYNGNNVHYGDAELFFVKIQNVTS